jgi:hypothetical protein
MRHAQFSRRVCGFILAIWAVASAGCTHHHYYGNALPACGPVATVPATVSNGSVCEVPTVGGGPLFGRARSGATIVSSAPYYQGARAPRVVVSEPSNGPRLGRWHAKDPESSVATLRVEGAEADPTATR